MQREEKVILRIVELHWYDVNDMLDIIIEDKILILIDTSTRLLILIK